MLQRARRVRDVPALGWTRRAFRPIAEGTPHQTPCRLELPPRLVRFCWRVHEAGKVGVPARVGGGCGRRRGPGCRVVCRGWRVRARQQLGPFWACPGCSGCRASGRHHHGWTGHLCRITTHRPRRHRDISNSSARPGRPGTRIVTFAGRVLNVSHSHITVEKLVLDGQYSAADTVIVSQLRRLLHVAESWRSGARAGISSISGLLKVS